MNIETEFRKEWERVINIINGSAAKEKEQKKQFEKCNKCIWGKRISNSKTYCFFPRCVR